MKGSFCSSNCRVLRYFRPESEMLSWNSFASLLFAMVILAVPVALGDLHDPYGMLEGLNHHPLPPEDIPFSEDPPHQNYSLDDLDDLFLDEMGNEDRPMKKIECLLLIEKEILFSSQEKREIGNLDEEATWCNRSWDSILCWPPTAAGTLGVLPCFDELNGIKYNTSLNATRFCYSNGTWAAYTDYTGCREVEAPRGGGPLFESGVELATALYFAGYSLSLVALAVAISIFLYFKDLRCLRNTIHTNLMCTYMLADFMWILTLTLEISTNTDTISCVVLVIVLHYFHLTNFFWMFVEGFYLYMLVVETFKTENIKLRVYVTIGWGIPVLVTAVWVIAKSIAPSAANFPETQLSPPLSNADSLFRHCPWMRPHTLDWIYQAPAMGLLFVNSIFLVMIMWVLITKLRSATNAETQQYRKATKALLVLIPLLGITYVLVIAGPTHGLSARVYACICAILLSTQGFTVALFYCFLNSEVQNHVRHHIERWKISRTVGSRRSYAHSKDWSPKSRSESVRNSNLAPGFISRTGIGGKGKKKDPYEGLAAGGLRDNINNGCSSVSANTPLPPINQYLQGENVV